MIDPEARRGRAAVAALFLANGALFANVVPRYPDLTSALGLTNAAFGAAVAAYALGALLAGAVAGALVSRWGSGRVAPVTTVVMAANVVLVGAAPSWLALAGALFAAGALDAVADVANNAHGLRVERRHPRPILNSLHALWSIGAVVGGSMGAAASALGLPIPVHLAVAAVLFGATAAVAARFVLPGRDGDPGRAAAPRARWLATARTVLALGVIAGSAQLIEDVGATWAGLYLRDELGAAAGVAGLGFVALQAAQTAGRLVGDRVVGRFGDRAVAAAGSTLAAGSMAAALAVPTVPTTVAAFAAAGLGIGTLIPAALRRVDAVPGLPPGAGIAGVGSVLRVLALVSPPVIGVAADRVGLWTAPAAVVLAGVVVLLLSRSVGQPDR